MKEEIKEIIDYFKSDIDYLEEELKYPNFKGRYITIRDKECEYLKKLLDYITNLQEENKNLKNEQISKYQTLKDLQEENERLVELCNRYEEEHKTTFKIWKKDLKNFEHEKNRELKSRIDKATEYIKSQNRFIQGCDINLIIDWEYVLNILKGSEKE
jgi:hypothetical protein